MLEKSGFVVHIAADGRAALELVVTQRYQAIFMDCHMPELDGYQTTAEIRRQEGSSRHVPIIAMTANTMTGDRERCLEAGMDDYITKPVDRRNLNEVIARWIRHKEAASHPPIAGRNADFVPATTPAVLAATVVPPRGGAPVEFGRPGRNSSPGSSATGPRNSGASRT